MISFASLREKKHYAKNTTNQPNVVCYSSAITACEKGGEWRIALHLLLKMIKSDVPPDTIAYNAAIRARYASSKTGKCGGMAEVTLIGGQYTFEQSSTPACTSN